MAKFYFTYGTENYPFIGGWSEIEAPDRDTAIDMFKKCHPSRRHEPCELLNCAFVYSEDEFKLTDMKSHGNFGKRCHEVITNDIIKELDESLDIMSNCITKENCELEINYDNERHCWYAANYSESRGSSEPMTDKHGEYITLFHNMAHNTVVNILNNKGVYYCG